VTKILSFSQKFFFTIAMSDRDEFANTKHDNFKERKQLPEQGKNDTIILLLY
jgi:hypothetical protein